MATALTAPDKNAGTSSNDFVTHEEFANMQFDERVELIDGKIVSMGSNNFNHGALTIRMGAILDGFVRPNKLGQVLGGDVAVLIETDPPRSRAADVIFASTKTLEQRGDFYGLDIAPEIIVEIISPSNTWDHVMDKIEDYFAIEVKQVWIVAGKTQRIYVHTSTVDVQGYSAKNEAKIDASDVIPGFELALTDVFEGM